jgi:hypothetical protein
VSSPFALALADVPALPTAFRAQFLAERGELASRGRCRSASG